MERRAQAYSVENVQEHPTVQFYWNQESEEEPGEAMLESGIENLECQETFYLGEFASQLMCVVFIFILHPLGQEVI